MSTNMEMDEFRTRYMEFLQYNRTEREVIENIKEALLKLPGVYVKTRADRGLVAVFNRFGRVRIIGAHVDSPRIDLKMKPLYGSDGLCYLDTHYYGGITKYQWVTTPLGLDGIVCRPGQESVKIRMGLPEHPTRPTEPGVFCITDLLPHLSHKRMEEKTADEVIEGENMDIIAGIAPVGAKDNDDDDDDNIATKNVQTLLKDRYGISKDDLLSAELSLVPANNVSTVGFDGELVGGYGQDDRSCAWAAFSAFVDAVRSDTQHYNSIVLILTDKEEIGSEGVTGAQCDWYLDTMLELLELDKMPKDAKMISADVTAAYDPMYSDAYCERVSAKLGEGAALSKYTGGGGKYDSSDASPEYVAWMRGVIGSIKFQSDEMGKIDAGGGGTIAMFFARKGIDVIDIGIPILNMHSPFEIAAFRDIESARDIYREFYTVK